MGKMEEVTVLLFEWLLKNTSLLLSASQCIDCLCRPRLNLFQNSVQTVSKSVQTVSNSVQTVKTQYKQCQNSVQCQNQYKQCPNQYKQCQNSVQKVSKSARTLPISRAFRSPSLRLISYEMSQLKMWQFETSACLQSARCVRYFNT